MTHVVGLAIKRGRRVKYEWFRSTYRWYCSCGAGGEELQGREGRKASIAGGREHEREARTG